MGADRQAALAALEAQLGPALEGLVELARIPGVSAAGFDPAEVARSAECVARQMRDVGLHNVEIVTLGDAHPYVLAEWLGAGPDAPTVLLYAHHDVQPPGRAARWLTPAFEPTRRDGRLYGRGVVDDKAGLWVHLAAARAWFDSAGALPVNVKWIVEGEEEIGSPHLEAFLRTHRERLAADVIVLSDTANLAAGLPSLTTSLRGLVSVDVHVRALDHSIHSGMWGGPVLDAATALARLLARLVDDTGRPTIPGLDDDLPVPSPEDRARLAALPFDPEAFREEAGLSADAPLGGDPEVSAYEKLWLRPAVAVIALEAAPLATAANQLVDEARARVSVRVAPGQDPERVRDCVVRCLERDPPWGVRVETSAERPVPGWRIEPEGPAFEAACRALRDGFACEPVFIGCGGTIPFVGPFAEVLGGVPALLVGLEDPICNAHGENESLHLGDFTKAARAAVLLLDELSCVVG